MKVYACFKDRYEEDPYFVKIVATNKLADKWRDEGIDNSVEEFEVEEE